MNKLLNIKIPKNIKLFIVGDIHEHYKQFIKALNYFNNYNDLIFVSVGDILEKGFNCYKDIIKDIKHLANTNKGYIVKGNHEFKVIRDIKKYHKKTNTHLQWLNNQPISLSFEFYNGSRVTIVHGGVTPKYTLEDLIFNVEVAYIRLLDKNHNNIKMKHKIQNGMRITYPASKNGRVWHDFYDGRFGYIISGHHSQKDGIPKFYNYSCNIDTACYHTGKLTAIIYGEHGKEDLLTFTDKCRFPNLNDMMREMAKGKV